MKKYSEPYLEVAAFAVVESVHTAWLSLTGNTDKDVDGAVPENWTYDGD